MTNWTQNIIWILGLIIAIFVLILERVFGPPLVFFWVLSWLSTRLKLDVRLWMTVLVASLSLALGYNLSFGLASILVSLVVVVAHQTFRFARLWLVVAILVLSGLVTVTAHLDLRYYGIWCIVISLVAFSWWLVGSRQPRQVVWLDKWSSKL